MKRFLIGALALGLSGCGMTSETALFSPSQAAPHGLADGAWALHGPGCEVEPGRPLPDCAVPLAFRDGRVELDGSKVASRIGGGGGAAASQAPASVGYLLVDGDPNIFQIQADIAPGSTQPKSEKRAYMAIRPLHRDASGRIDRAILWTIPCPKPGETVDGIQAAAGGETQGGCTVSKPEAVHAQALHLPPLFSYYLTRMGPNVPPAGQ